MYNANGSIWRASSSAATFASSCPTKPRCSTELIRTFTASTARRSKTRTSRRAAWQTTDCPISIRCSTSLRNVRSRLTTISTRSATRFRASSSSPTTNCSVYLAAVTRHASRSGDVHVQRPDSLTILAQS